jgi:hypothetical protein
LQYDALFSNRRSNGAGRQRSAALIFVTVIETSRSGCRRHSTIGLKRFSDDSKIQLGTLALPKTEGSLVETAHAMRKGESL